MSKPTRAVLALLLLAGFAAAQDEGGDPRDAKDPRDVADPRKASDPRGEPQDRFAQLEGKELYDALYAAGEETRLAAALRTDAWQILGYIDSHCEGWLALIESGAAETPEGRAKLADVQAKGRKLAELADRALGDTRFTVYVQNFYSWDTEQRKSFREGQALFRTGARLISEASTPQEALSGLTPLQQSLERSRPLSDTWGQSMALVLMGRVQADNAQTGAALANLDEARRLGRQIRDLSSVWDALAVRYETSLVLRHFDEAKEALQEQFLIARDLDDEKTGAMITRQMVQLEKTMAGG
jgi:hypothetical protein